MARILPFPERPPAPEAVPLGPAQILFFMGVRYVREAEPARTGTQKRTRRPARQRGDSPSRHSA